MAAAKKKPAAKKTAAKKTAGKPARKPGRQPTDRQPKKKAQPAAQPETVRLSSSTLTNRDLVDFEDVVGDSFDEVFDGSGRELTYRESLAVHWIALRKTIRPGITWEQILDMGIDEMDDIIVDLTVDGDDPEGDAAGSDG